MVRGLIYPSYFILFISTIGAILRYILTLNFGETLKRRVEVVTPISDWRRAYEAVQLWNSGINPYYGNIFHESPISLQFYKFIITYFNVNLVFILTDILTAIFLSCSVYNQLLISGHSSKEARSRSNFVILIYALCPINAIACAGNSTSIFTNFLVATIAFILPLKPFRALTCVLCALLAYNNLHYAAIALSVFLCLEFCSRKRVTKDCSNQKQSNNVKYYHDDDFYSSLAISLTIFTTALVTLLLTSYFLMGSSWTFINSTYLFVLRVDDLTPNIGMFWYFFTEMFEHFLNFFTCIVQINAFIHVIPLSIGLRDHPFLALYVTVFTTTLFQPYPSLSDLGLILSLLPRWYDLFEHMRHGLKVVCAIVSSLSLLPIFWHLWIVNGTANSNFYFGATLALNTALVVLMMDLLNAHSFKCATKKLDDLKIENDGAEDQLTDQKT